MEISGIGKSKDLEFVSKTEKEQTTNSQNSVPRTHRRTASLMDNQEWGKTKASYPSDIINQHTLISYTPDIRTTQQPEEETLDPFAKKDQEFDELYSKNDLSGRSLDGDDESVRIVINNLKNRATEVVKNPDKQEDIHNEIVKTLKSCQIKDPELIASKMVFNRIYHTKLMEFTLQSKVQKLKMGIEDKLQDLDKKIQMQENKFEELLSNKGLDKGDARKINDLKNLATGAMKKDLTEVQAKISTILQTSGINTPKTAQSVALELIANRSVYETFKTSKSMLQDQLSSQIEQLKTAMAASVLAHVFASG